MGRSKKAFIGNKVTKKDCKCQIVLGMTFQGGGNSK